MLTGGLPPAHSHATPSAPAAPLPNHDVVVQRASAASTAPAQTGSAAVEGAAPRAVVGTGARVALDVARLAQELGINDVPSGADLATQLTALVASRATRKAAIRRGQDQVARYVPGGPREMVAGGVSEALASAEAMLRQFGDPGLLREVLTEVHAAITAADTDCGARYAFALGAHFTPDPALVRAAYAAHVQSEDFWRAGGTPTWLNDKLAHLHDNLVSAHPKLGIASTTQDFDAAHAAGIAFLLGRGEIALAQRVHAAHARVRDQKLPQLDPHAMRAGLLARFGEANFSGADDVDQLFSGFELVKGGMDDAGVARALHKRMGFLLESSFRQDNGWTTKLLEEHIAGAERTMSPAAQAILGEGLATTLIKQMRVPETSNRVDDALRVIAALAHQPAIERLLHAENPSGRVSPTTVLLRAAIDEAVRSAGRGYLLEATKDTASEDRGSGHFPRLMQLFLDKGAFTQRDVAQLRAAVRRQIDLLEGGAFPKAGAHWLKGIREHDAALARFAPQPAELAKDALPFAYIDLRPVLDGAFTGDESVDAIGRRAALKVFEKPEVYLADENTVGMAADAAYTAIRVAVKDEQVAAGNFFAAFKAKIAAALGVHKMQR